MYFEDNINKLQMVYSLASTQGTKSGSASRVIIPPFSTYVHSSAINITTVSPSVNQHDTASVTLSMEYRPQPYITSMKRCLDHDQHSPSEVIPPNGPDSLEVLV